MTTSNAGRRGLLLTAWLATQAAQPNAHAQQKADPLLEGFLNPPPEARMRMYWHVFGPAWNHEGIDHQLTLLRQAGVGGVTLIPFYPVAIDDPARGIKNQAFLSREFLDNFAYAAKKAKSLGLRFSVEGGTGWPFGGPTVRLQDAAQRIRRVAVPPTADGTAYAMPTLQEGERILAAWRQQRRIDLPAIGDERPHGNEPLTLFVTGPTYMKVKRAALGADGYVLDHYNTPALERWLEANVSPLLRAAPGLVESIFCDSLEVYNANWTHDLPQVFLKRRGYDLVSRLVELFDDKGVTSPDLRFDFWRTLAELNEERFTKPLGAWSGKHGVKLEMEAYGTPPSPLTSFRHIDVPTGEQYEWMGFSFSRYASSGGHLAAKRVIGAEAWTWTGIPNRLVDSLRDLKLASDFHFLAGINDLTGVGFSYSPPSVAPPGWLPYFGPVMNQNNPQWPFFKYLVQYVNRSQWLLRQGKPIAQIALYLPVEQAFARGPVAQMPLDFLLRDHFVTGEKTGEFSLVNARKHRSDLIHTLVTRGYNFDGIDFWTLIRQASIKGGKLICGDGAYSVVILPDVEGMELEALEKLAEFVRQGGTLIATGRTPDRSFGGASGNRARDLRLKQLSRELFGGSYVGRGKTAFVGAATDVTSSAVFTEGARNAHIAPLRSEPSVASVQRRTSDYDIVFVANTADVPADFTFGHQKTPVLQLDPATGEHRVRLAPGGTARPLPVHLAARGSTFLLYPRRATAESRSRLVRLDATDVSSRESVRKWDGAEWKVTFSGPDAPRPVLTGDLVSWIQWPGGKAFSGQATYETTFAWDEPAGGSIKLRFHEVREAGEVWVNDKLAGGVWLPPYDVEIGPLLKQGKNTVKVTVGNLMLNRLLGLPDEDLRPLRAAYGNRFPDPQEKKVTKDPPPAGLIGPVELIRE